MAEELGNCFFCNGFYGPTHGEYICGTCHLFLYADDRHPDLVTSIGVVDENDSGNDEPSEGQLSNERFVNKLSEQQSRSSTDSSSSSMQRYLNHRVQELSVGNNGSLNGRCNNVENSKNSENNVVDHFARLPLEVCFMIFRHLDTLSLWSLSIACPYLTNLVQANMSDDRWKASVVCYWPLYKPLYEESWYNAFTKLVMSSPCKSCLIAMMNDIDGKTAIDIAEIDSVDNSTRYERMRLECSVMRTDASEGVKAMPMDTHLLNWCASIQGPVNSPYEGGLFFLYVQFPFRYPFQPPKIRFITRIFHPNVSRHGDIGLDCINHKWSAALTIAKILISVQSLLTDPYCKVCMEPVIAKLYETDRNTFNRKATEWTYKYAMSDILSLHLKEELDDRKRKKLSNCQNPNAINCFKWAIEVYKKIEPDVTQT